MAVVYNLKKTLGGSLWKWQDGVEKVFTIVGPIRAGKAVARLSCESCAIWSQSGSSCTTSSQHCQSNCTSFTPRFNEQVEQGWSSYTNE
jgi:hypothetical protein